MSLTREVACPDDVLAAIAWYPEGLDEDERGAVEAHAADCVACRDELAFVHGTAMPVPPQPEAQRVYARVLERIEGYERERSSAERPAAVAVPARGAAPLRARSPMRAPLRAAAALFAAALVGGFTAWTALRSAEPAEPVYETASEAGGVSAAAPAATLALDVVFRPDATAERIHAALRAIGGEIVAGPTQIGVYRVRLAPTADAGAAIKVLQGDGQGVATFAGIAPR
jgi:hypothetical protein